MRLALDAVLRTPRSSREEESAFSSYSMQALAASWGLMTLRACAPATLPYGHRRLLDIARPSWHRRDASSADEPAAGLNPTEAAHVSALIGRIRAAGIDRQSW